MWAILVAGAALMASAGKSPEPQVRSFLVLNSDTVDVVGGKLEPAKWPLVEGRNPKVHVETIDGVEFRMDRSFWQMIEKNDAKFDARPEVKVGRDGQVTFRGKSVDVGIRLGGVQKALHWNGWVVGVTGIIGDAQHPEATIEGTEWYVVWFSETTLKGSFRRIGNGLPTLRIYSR